MATLAPDDFVDAVEGAEADVAAGGQAGAMITAQAQSIAAALAGHDGASVASPASGAGGGGGGGGHHTIGDTDDLTALMMMVRCACALVSVGNSASCRRR